MPAYLTINSAGQTAERNPVTQSLGAASGGEVLGLKADGTIDPSVFPPGYGPTVLTVPASESLAAGAMVNLWNNSGSLSVRNADASGGFGKKVDGYVLSAAANGANATVYRGGVNSSLSGLTPGTLYFLSASTPGSVVAAPPTPVTGQILQAVGKASSASAIAFNLTEPVIRA